MKRKLKAADTRPRVEAHDKRDLTEHMLDIIIIGGGPAGLSAAITARQRGKTAAVISNDSSKSGLYKAKEIGNYPGFPAISGAELLGKLIAHAGGMGAELISGRVSTVMPGDREFHIGYGSEILAAKSLILATGVAQSSLFPGEEELLGRGVSYCATCDGMLYRGKRVCALCYSPESGEEAEHLASIGCEVIRLSTKNIRINGDDRVTSVTADGADIACEGVFILRKAIAPNMLITGLKMEKGHVSVNSSGETSVPGVFAAGDCTGAPYQIARAVGQGLVAALSADDYITK